MSNNKRKLQQQANLIDNPILQEYSERYVSTKQMAAGLKVSVKTVYNYRNRNLLVFHRIGNRIKYDSTCVPDLTDLQ